MWECLRLAETSECYIGVIKYMHDGATRTVRCAAGLTKEFEVGVGLHRSSALSPFLFCHHYGRPDIGHQKEAPWDMMFADDIVLSGQNYK